MPDPVLDNDQMPSLPAGAGDVIDGKYVVGDCIAWGGMGVVFEATHVDLATHVAIKCVREEFAGSEEIVRRFLQEARAAARLGTEHVARVMDFGRMANGAPYMVMERLYGEDLATILFERGALPVEEAVGYVLQAAEGLAEAHLLGIVHRDIKPENLFLARTVDGRETIKVLDFGISKQLAVRGRSLTNPAHSIGSPSYMSPEQMRNAHDADARSDIWSLGVVLFELLTAGQPFRGDTLPEICASVISDAPQSLLDARPGVPPQLDAIVRHCLQKDRASRFQDVIELASALAPFASATERASLNRVERAAAGVAPATNRTLPPPRAPEAASVVPVALDGAITHIPGVRSRWPYAAALGALAAVGGVMAANQLGYAPIGKLPGWTLRAPALNDAPLAMARPPQRAFTAPLPLLIVPRAEPEPSASAAASGDAPPPPVAEYTLEAVQRRARARALLREARERRGAPAPPSGRADAGSGSATSPSPDALAPDAGVQPAPTE